MPRPLGIKNHWENRGSEIWIKIRHDLWTVIDAQDFSIIKERSWHDVKSSTGTFYAVSSNGKQLSRTLMGNPKGIVDHIDRDPLNNRKSNLRIGTISLNSVNKVTYGRWKRGTWPSGKKFMALARNNGKRAYLGTFSTEGEAHQAYVDFAKSLHGEWLPEGCPKALNKAGNLLRV